MNVSGTLSAASRRVVVALGLAVFLSLSSGTWAQGPAAEEPVEQEAQADPLKFSRGGRMFIVYQIKAGMDQDFVLAWQTIKDHLMKMGDSALSQFAQGINILKVDTPAGGDAIYIFDLNPASTTYSYNPVTLLYETLAENPEKPGVGLSYDQATEIYDKIKDSYNSITPWPLTPVR